MQRGGRVIHPVDELARQFGEENPNASEMAAYRETARRLYDRWWVPAPKCCPTCNYWLVRDGDIEGGYLPCEYCFYRRENADLKQQLEGMVPASELEESEKRGDYMSAEIERQLEERREQVLRYDKAFAQLQQQLATMVPAEKFESMRHVICNDCKGHQMFTIEDDTIYVHHGCINGKHGREIWEQQEKDHEQQLSTMVPAEYVRKISDELIALALQLGFLKEDFVITNEELLSMSKSMREEIQKLALHEGLYSEAQVEWATYDAVLEWSGDVRNAIDIRTSVITRLTRPQESVTIHQDPDNFDCYEVHLYNQTIHSFHGLVHAERYAAGLREDIASKEQK